MMPRNRIGKKFAELKNKGRKAFVAYITAGDPGLRETEEIALALEQAGVDVLEVGVPFSDPTADGPVIQEASQRALKNGTTLAAILDMIGSLRRKCDVPIVLFSYYNPIFSYGVEAFARDAAKAGVDGVLVVDLPWDEADELKRHTAPRGMDFIHLIAPTSGEQRMKEISRAASGFLYYISVTGITGTQAPVADQIEGDVKKIKSFTDVPVVAGFGISNPQAAAAVAAKADGIVIGSAIVKMVAESRGENIIGAIRSFAEAVRTGINQSGK